MDADLIRNISVYAIPVILAITVHEAAHGYAARHFGDMTAALMGRITLNPLAHIDLIGTILMPLILLAATNGQFAFGYAKPVPVNFLKLRNPTRDMMWVALAGPLSNWIQALIWALIYAALELMGVNERFFIAMAMGGISVNLVLCVLNLFPLPPLDGGRILVSLLPYNAARLVAQTERYGMFIVMGLVMAGILSKIWIIPLMQAGFTVIEWVIFKPLGIW